MRVFLFVCVFLGFWMQTFAQEYGKLVVGKDTTFYYLKIVHQKGEIVVLYKTAYQSSWNEIYAENANAAFISDKNLYLSLKLPDTSKKVWVKCVFDGEYQLLQYRYGFYIAEPGKISKLENGKMETTQAETTNRKLFAGQMIVIFNKKFDYNFNLLSYDSKSLVLPLIKYHETNHLLFHDYNNYIEVNSNFSLSAGVSQDNYLLSTNLVEPIDIKGYHPFLAANLGFCFPELSKYLFFSGGIELSNTKLDVLKIQTFLDKIYYFELSFSGLTLEIPAMVGYRLFENPVLSISLETGLKVSKWFSLDQNLRIETERNGVVQTELAKMGNDPDLNVFHCSELLFGMPSISKSIKLGASYNYSLIAKNQAYNTIRLERSLMFFTRFNF